MVMTFEGWQFKLEFCDIRRIYVPLPVRKKEIPKGLACSTGGSPVGVRVRAP